MMGREEVLLLALRAEIIKAKVAFCITEGVFRNHQSRFQSLVAILSFPEVFHH